MISVKYFNIQLLCVALVLTPAMMHSNPLRVAFRRIASSAPKPPIAEELAAKLPKERSYVALYPTVTKEIESIYKDVHHLRYNQSNKLVRFLSLIVVAETAYIINDKYPDEVRKHLDMGAQKALELKDMLLKETTPAAQEVKKEATTSETNELKDGNK